MKKVGIVMGSDSDLPVIQKATDLLKKLEIPFEVLQRCMTRIINEVRGVNRVLYDLTSKPPGTIELE